MTLKTRIAKLSGVKEVPGSWQFIGDIALAKFSSKSDVRKKKIAESLMTILKNVKTVCEIKEVRGELREPVVNVISGTNTITTHKENDVLYKIDVAKVMFSKGNLTERKRLLTQVKANETVIDMFAGIGYFSLPIAKFTGAKVISIEKNPTSYNFLVENVALNKLNNVTAIQGDCKIAARGLGGRADRVIMGYFPGTEEFLPAAMFMAKTGCMIHYHNIYFEKDLWKKPLEELESVAKAMNKKYEVVAKKKVKSVGPRKWHVVIDFRVVAQ
ncbi:MAG TPA: class I SAM-dependent methyltransferase family protein [archaeon]|nr:class I SAM-dependent methyltransferase family protein [archaeon]